MSTDLELRETRALAPLGDPEAEVEWASRCARALVQAINGNPQLKVAIQGRDYIKVEGWQTLGAMTKIDRVEVVWCREYTPPGADKPIGWEARVEVRDREGNVRGTGEAMCVRSERTWASRDEFAIRSMAQTRAMGKAYRMALSYVVSLAGYEPTPAEEMPAFVPPVIVPPELVPIFAELKTLDAGHDWPGVAEKYAQREFGHGVGALTKPELKKTVETLTGHLESLRAAA